MIDAALPFNPEKNCSQPVATSLTAPLCTRNSFVKGFKHYLTAHDFHKNIKIKGNEYVINKFREIDNL